ncbi:hypothetical protein BDF21DRAFT_422205 [Thamnidium elegans]|nr:hypothetical protein BDF21DRAFT_422205 [Thamnidium elegans]
MIWRRKWRSTNVTFNISVSDSASVNSAGTNVVVHSPQPQQQQTYPQGNSDEDDTRVPSDLTVDHHPKRTSDYILSHVGHSVPAYEAEAEDYKWLIDNECISDLCHNSKDSIIQLISTVRPSEFSNLRLLVLNDIYFF